MILLRKIATLFTAFVMICCVFAACEKGTEIDIKKEMFTVNVTQGANGTVSTDKTSVEKGGNLKVTMTPEAGYIPETLHVNGKAIEVSGEEVTLCDVQENLEIGAIFADADVTVSFVSDISEEIFGDKEVVYGGKYGDLPLAKSYKSEANGDEVNVFKGWNCNGVLVTSDTIVFEKSDHTLEAVYEKVGESDLMLRKPYSLTVAYYDAYALSLGISFHTKGAPYMPVIQISEGDTFDESTAETYICDTRSWETEYVNQTALNDLEFGKTYTYRAGDYGADMWSESYTITTRDGGAETSYIYLADTQQPETNAGTGVEITAGALMLEEAANRFDADFIVHGGDLVDKGDNPEFWKEMLGDMGEILGRLPVVFVQGVHESSDYYCQNVTDLFESMFNVNYPQQSGADDGAYYSLDIGAMHLVVLRSNDVYFNGGKISQPQIDWLISDLASANENQQTVWNVVAIHEPLFYPGSQTANSQTMRSQLMPVLREGKVDVVLQAYTHNSYMSYPLEYTEDANIRDFEDKQEWARVAVSAEQKSSTTVEGCELVCYDDYISGEEGTVFYEAGAGGPMRETKFAYNDKADNLSKYPLIQDMYSGGNNCTFADGKSYSFYGYIEVTSESLTIRTYAFNEEEYLASQAPSKFVYGIQLTK